LTYAQKLCCGASKTAEAALPRCKFDSARKLLIYKGFRSSPFCGQRSQAVDFPSPAPLPRLAINKVIHKKWGRRAKGFKINDLKLSSRPGLNLGPRWTG